MGFFSLPEFLLALMGGKIHPHFTVYSQLLAVTSCHRLAIVCWFALEHT